MIARMKKSPRWTILVFLTLLFFLPSCLPASKPASPTETSLPTLTPTYPPTPTITFTPTLTATPTIIKIPTVDYNLTPTPPGFIFLTPTPFPWIPTSTPLPTATPATAGEGFDWVKISDQILYWGSCRGSKIKVSAKVIYPQDVVSMTLFVRLRRDKAKIFTPWSKGLGMEPTGVEGVWAQDLHGVSIDNHELWRRGWVWYQVVAVGENGVEVARSRVFTDVLKLEPCMCLTPPCAPGD